MVCVGNLFLFSYCWWLFACFAVGLCLFVVIWLFALWVELRAFWFCLIVLYYVCFLVYYTLFSCGLGLCGICLFYVGCLFLVRFMCLNLDVGYVGLLCYCLMVLVYFVSVRLGSLCLSVCGCWFNWFWILFGFVDCCFGVLLALLGKGVWWNIAYAYGCRYLWFVVVLWN